MRSSPTITKTAKLTVLLCLPFLGHAALGQTPAPSPSTEQQQPEVLRVFTELVQTDVMVFDRQGKFVNGLNRQDFELRIDDKPKPIEFFEKITAGSISEEAQLAAARGAANRANAATSAGPAPMDRGRPIFFYLDDLHMDLQGLTATQKLISHFIDKEVGQNDEAAIASASGQIGFLQQLTDNKAVLRAALERLKVRPYTVRDFESPAMTEHQALLITNYDLDITSYFVDETMRRNPGMPRDAAEAQVATRARSLVQQAGQITVNTLTGLEGLIRSAQKLPGRKLVFFISGGFYLDDRNSDSLQRLQRITSEAAHSGVVIYSMDARGLVTGLPDASTGGEFDLSGRVSRAAAGELLASQDGLNALAHDTGGKAILNTNSLEPGLSRALKETASYYLLAWKPDKENQRAGKFRRIEVKVIGKPGLLVQVRRGFFDIEPTASASKPAKTKKGKDEAPVANSPEAELRKVIFAPYPNRDLPVSLNLSYVNTPSKGLMLSAVLNVSTEFFSFAPANGKQTAVVTVAGIFFNDRGESGASFDNRITMDAPSIEVARQGQDFSYGHTVFLKPGIYQVRVGVRDENSGHAGSAHEWIEIPNLASGQLVLSSLLIGLREQPTITDTSIGPKDPGPDVQLSVSHKFTANGYLRFLVFVYNGALAPTDSKPDVALQVQVVRDEQPVVTTALKKLATEGLSDLRQIPYAAEISLKGLPAGRYLLKVTVVDRVAKHSASQQTRFDIE
jgi:VWFA-related protein